MRRIVSILSAGIRFRAMRAKRASSLSCRANFAESLMPNWGLLLIIIEATTPRVLARESGKQYPTIVRIT